MNRLLVCTCVSLMCALSTAAFAQGVQTATIRGSVHDQQDLPVPGATVTVTSPALQGTRTIVTGPQGDYTISALPPGDYTITYELSGFGTVTRSAPLPLGLTLEQNVVLLAAGVSERVEVVAETPAPIATPVVGLNLKHDEIEVLANSRNIVGIATLAPGVSEAAPTPTALVISGGLSFDNVIMVNGVDVVDNVFATPQNLFIEDAIEETQGTDVGHLGGVRTIRRRRHQRDYQVGRQQVFGLRAAEPVEPVVDYRNTVRDPARHRGFRASVKYPADLRGHPWRPDRQRPAVVLRRRPVSVD